MSASLLTRLTETTLTILDFFIPNRQMKNIDLDLCRRLVASNIVQATTAFFFFLFIFVVQDFKNSMVTSMTFVSTILFGVNPLIIKYAKLRNALHIVAYLTCIEVVCVNTMFNAGLGGFKNMGQQNIAMLPLYAFFAAGALPGLMTTILTMAEVTYFYLNQCDMPHTVTDRIVHDVNSRKEVQLVNYFITLAVSAFIGWIYESTHFRAHSLIERSLQQVNQLTAVGHPIEPFSFEQSRAPSSGRKRSGSGSDSARVHNELHYSGGRNERRESPPDSGRQKNHKE